MSSLPSNPSESTKRLNPALYGPAPASADPLRIPTYTELAPPSMLSTDEAKLNKTERSFLVHLREAHPGNWIGVQCITLKLADDCRYTCDIWERTIGGLLYAYEVKGFFRDDAKVKIKVAARMFPWIRFVVVKRGPNALVPWLMETVKP